MNMAEPNKTTNAAATAAPGSTALAKPAVASTPAPAAAVVEPKTLNEFAELARKHIAGELTATPAPEPAAPGQEPSPEPQTIEPAEPSPDPTPEATAEPTAEPQEPVAGADDVSNWTEGEKKLHGALEKERAESKEARATVRELKAKLAELESKITATVSPAEPAAPAERANAAPSAADMLADCPSFEAVDARVMQAAATESQAVRLSNMLTRNGAEPVVARLKASGVETIQGTPIAEATAEQLGDFLERVYDGARMTQAQSGSRKAWLANNQQSLAAAVQILPELNDANSNEYKAAAKIVSENPMLRQRADWPVIVAKLCLGEAVFNAKANAKGNGAAVTAKPAIRPSRPAPGAPRTATGAIPQASTDDVLRSKIEKGTASLREVQEYARARVAA